MNDENDEILSDAGFENAVRAKNEITMECLEHFFRSVPYGHRFALSNGMEGELKKFIDPRMGEQPEAGIDVVLLKDGVQIGHIEIMIRQTGWGMDPTALTQ